MRFVIQRVLEAGVTIGGVRTAKIGRGMMVLVGVSRTDDRETADRMIKKMLNLRIFEDENGKTNLNLASVGGELLMVSQFTLYADCTRGNRPGFTNAGEPQAASELYDYILSECRRLTGTDVRQGVFGADMKVDLVNDGPFTILLDSEDL